MDVLTLVLWVLRIAFLLGIYLVLLLVVRAIWRDLRATVRGGPPALGRLVVLASPLGQPEQGLVIPLDAVTTLGRDVNSSVVIDDGRVADDHALLAYRGWSWVLEDRTDGEATRVNGRPAQGMVVLGYGDQFALGDVRFRLDRSPDPGPP